MAARGLPAKAVGHEAQRHVTFMPFFDGDGRLVAVFFFIQGKRMCKKFLMAYPGAYMIMTESGGIDSESWMALWDTLEKILPHPCVLMLDGHATRRSDQRRIYDGYKNGGIRLVLAPAHSTHMTQVADVALFPAFNPQFNAVSEGP